MKNIIFIVFLMLSYSNLLAENTRQNAMDCVSARTTYSDKSNLKFKNKCNYIVSVIWCGELNNSYKICGEGKNDTFYTHSRNLGPFENYRVELKSYGTYKYAACKGNSSFQSNDIIHNKKDNGVFTCKKADSYTKANSIDKQNLDSLQRWNITVQQANGKWHSQVVVLKNNGEAFYIYTDEKYYLAKWYKIANKVSVNVFKDAKEVNKSTPSFTLTMHVKNSQFTGEIIMHATRKSFPTKGYKSKD